MQLFFNCFNCWSSKMYRHMRNRKHWRLSVVQVRNVYYFLTFSFSTRGETQFLLCWLFLNCPQSTPQLDWPDPRVKSQLTAFFKNHQILSPSLLGMTSFTSQSHFLSGVFIMTFVIVVSSARQRELNSMCVHLHRH